MENFFVTVSHVYIGHGDYHWSHSTFIAHTTKEEILARTRKWSSAAPKNEEILKLLADPTDQKARGVNLNIGENYPYGAWYRVKVYKMPTHEFMVSTDNPTKTLGLTPEVFWV